MPLHGPTPLSASSFRTRSAWSVMRGASYPWSGRCAAKVFLPDRALSIGPFADRVDLVGPMRVAFLLLASCATQVPDPSGGGSASAAAVTYYRDVAPILAENCWGCHGENGIAFRSEGYQYAAANSRIIAEKAADGSMPPWPPSDACMPLDHVRQLTDEQRTTLAEWDALGAPEGD